MIKAIKLIDYCFKFERASFRSSGGRGVDRLLVMENRDALVKGGALLQGISSVYFVLSESLPASILFTLFN